MEQTHEIDNEIVFISAKFEKFQKPCGHPGQPSAPAKKEPTGEGVDTVDIGKRLRQGSHAELNEQVDLCIRESLFERAERRCYHEKVA